MSNYPTHSRIYNIKADSLDSTKLTSVKAHSIINKPVENSSLSGLLADYNSDSEYEETNGHDANKLDAKVDDFLEEINQLSCPEPKRITTVKASASAWQSCIDELTGYPYYWNVETNVVTWDIPREYDEYLKTLSQVDFIKETHEKPQNVPKYVKKPEKQITPKPPAKKIGKMSQKRKVITKKIQRPSSDSEEEKIVMITSFSEDSSSESETEKTVVIKTESLPKQDGMIGPHIEEPLKEASAIPLDPNKKEIIEAAIDENIDETIILSRLRTQARVLQELGGDLPTTVDKSTTVDNNADKIQALSLVAGYGDDSDGDEEPIVPSSIFPISVELVTEIVPTESQSTLFPVTIPIDVKQFDLPVKPVALAPKEPPVVQDVDSDVQSKNFKRKKRLGIAFDVICEKRTKVSESEERKGFGFVHEDEEKIGKKDGVSFVKSDNIEVNAKKDEEDLEDFDAIKGVVYEKVTFLGEGKPVVSAVQIMAIQLQTLEAAFAAGGLSRNYLYSWLRETFTELGKLEQDAAPEGWHCQWDRLNKRYFYRHQLSGETQWTYPDADIIGGSEAMDICTTPPPIEDLPPPPPLPPPESPKSDPLPPSPPKIRDKSPTPPPPPPPVITSEEIQPPLPLHIEVVIPPPPPAISEPDIQPLPPGVDSPDPSYFPVKSTKESQTRDSLGTELDSFYSEIAAIEPIPVSETPKLTVVVDKVPSPAPAPTVVEHVDTSELIVKKKRKMKQKMGQGINMKKKAVSTLVEKWKKVQNDYL